MWRRGSIIHCATLISVEMMISTISRFASAVLLTLGVGPAAYGQDSVEITLKQGSTREAQTKEQLERLLKSYDVSRWIIQKSISIDEKAIPHSHPTLTLHTRHLHDDELLLSTFVHEQLHWFLIAQQRVSDTQQAIKELQGIFPAAPTKPPEGSDGEYSTYQRPRWTIPIVI